MSFVLYVIGFLLLIGGLAYGAILMHVPTVWIGVGVLVLLGLGLASGATSTRQKDPS